MAGIIRYDDFNFRVRDGDLLAFEGHRFFSFLIRFYCLLRRREYTKTTHVGIAAWWGDRLFVIEALEGKGVRAYPLSAYLSQGQDIKWCELKDNLGIDREKIVSFMRDRCGSHYSSLFQFLRSYSITINWICTKLKIPYDLDDTRWHCNEAVMDALRYAGYEGNGNLISVRATPSDCENMQCFEEGLYVKVI